MSYNLINILETIKIKKNADFNILNPCMSNFTIKMLNYLIKRRFLKG